MKVLHPEDISGIILTSYYRHLTGKEIRLEEQLKKHQEYWKIAAYPEKKAHPKKSGKLQFQSMFLYKRNLGGQGAVHIASNEHGEIWIYDFYFGWAKISEEELKELQSKNEDHMEEVARRIFRDYHTRGKF
jgi:hypothetical protein